MSALSYEEFVARKLGTVPPTGIPGDVHIDLYAGLFPHQKDLVMWALRRGRAAIFAATGLGKEQPITEPVLTPTGWKTMGDLRVGDYVVGSNGEPTQVTGVFPQGIKRVYRIELSDGSFVRCGHEHLWAVRTKADKYRGRKFRVLATKDIQQSLHMQWQLPMGDAPKMQYQELPIDPYNLGVLLGDGCLSKSGGASACTDNAIGEALGWRKLKNHESTGVGYWVPSKTEKQAILALGLQGKRSEYKFVPEVFLKASPEQRLSLLQGLMDTDGYAHPDGGAEFSSTSRVLVEAVIELVRSLGGVARGEREAQAYAVVNGERHQGKPAWRINVKLPPHMNMFRLSRKADRYVTPTKYPPNRIIRDVVDEGVDEDQVCISVAAADSLYVTRAHVLTHNTRMEIEWAIHVNQYTNKPVLMLAPLAVAAQTVREGRAMAAEVSQCRDQSDVGPGINITNYDRLHLFDPSAFGGVVLDESGCIKGFKSKTLAQLMEAFVDTPFRLCATATPAPNDHTELGCHAEFLGICRRTEMLSEYFKHDGTDTKNWHLKGHARQHFWKWVSQWGALVRNPSDLGHDGTSYNLPPLNIEHHILALDQSEVLKTGVLFAKEAATLEERRAARRASIDKRVQQCAAIVKGQTCPGSQSMPRIEGESHRKTPTTEQSETSRVARIKKSKSNTCSNTIQEIETSGFSLQNSAQNETLIDVANTVTMTHIVKTSSQELKSGQSKTRKSINHKGSRKITESTSKNIEDCLNHNLESVPYAAPQVTQIETIAAGKPEAFTSITATQQAQLEASCAPNATWDSGSSETIQNGYREPWIIWCELNDEQNRLERIFGDDCVSVYGALDSSEKERRINLFLSRQKRVLITKPSVAGWGLNFQHCNNMAFVGVNDSWEAYHQAVRRCWRFGQKKPVNVHIFASEAEMKVVENLARKEAQAAQMGEELSRETRDALREAVTGSRQDSNPYLPTAKVILPDWLTNKSANKGGNS